jgi:hypothetical protein
MATVKAKHDNVLIMDKVIMRSEGDDLFLYQGGKRIAIRGRPGTRQAGQWISLEPNIEVREIRKGGERVVDVVYSTNLRSHDWDSRGRLVSLWHSLIVAIAVSI